jgi:serine/threonine protein kinase
MRHSPLSRSSVAAPERPNSRFLAVDPSAALPTTPFPAKIPRVGEAAQYAPGQQLAGTVYRVVRHLATGGMGSVYDVEDVTVGKRYVLKTLHPQLVSRHDLAKRMEAEARALARLQHPNIVDVVTAGMTTDNQRMPFYVMERLNGQNLRVVIEKKGSLKLRDCFLIAIDVLDALEHAHENSVIHRDVKPENIFIHRNGNGTNTTKLLDFGIMRLLDRKASHTQGKFIGTLRYASPEQIFGGELGPATDIYSLGVVLYEMLAGRGPFDEIGDAYAIGAAHAQLPPPPISRFTAVPPELEQLVMSALAKQPQDRPRDCFSFASALRRMLRQEEAAPPPSATAVNPLTSAVPPTQGALPLAGTEQQAPPVRAFGATDVGMMPPSNFDPRAASLPATVRHGVAVAGSGVAAPPPGTDIGVAATLMSQPGGDAGRAAAAQIVAAQAAAVVAAAARDAAVAAADARGGSVPGMWPPIDRAAETRAGGPLGTTQRFAQHGTAIDDGGGRLLPEDDVRAALAQRYPLEVPPATGHPDDARGELMFPPNHGYATGTGPLSGEARTRPPEHGMLLPLLGAAVFGAMLVGGAVLLVTKPWQKHAASAGPPVVAVTTPVIDAPNAPVTTVTLAPAPVATTRATAAATVSPVAPTIAIAVAPAAPTARSTTPRTSVSPASPAGTAAALPAPGAPPAPASAVRKPARPGSGTPRPEDVPFE